MPLKVHQAGGKISVGYCCSEAVMLTLQRLREVYPRVGLSRYIQKGEEGKHRCKWCKGEAH